MTSKHSVLRARLKARDEQMHAIEIQMLKLLNAVRELRRDEIERLTKTFLHDELRKNSLNNDMFAVLCALFGTPDGILSYRRRTG